jgi:hypothetical protein
MTEAGRLSLLMCKSALAIGIKVLQGFVGGDEKFRCFSAVRSAAIGACTVSATRRFGSKMKGRQNFASRLLYSIMSELSFKTTTIASRKQQWRAAFI